jgi:hypothetical protein
MRCKACGARYSLDRFASLMDEDFEEKLANVSCDRL